MNACRDRASAWQSSIASADAERAAPSSRETSPSTSGGRTTESTARSPVGAVRKTAPRRGLQDDQRFARIVLDEQQLALAVGPGHRGGDDPLAHLGLQTSEHLHTGQRVAGIWQPTLHGQTPPGAALIGLVITVDDHEHSTELLPDHDVRVGVCTSPASAHRQPVHEPAGRLVPARRPLGGRGWCRWVPEVPVVRAPVRSGFGVFRHGRPRRAHQCAAWPPRRPGAHDTAPQLAVQSRPVHSVGDAAWRVEIDRQSRYVSARQRPVRGEMGAGAARRGFEAGLCAAEHVDASGLWAGRPVRAADGALHRAGPATASSPCCAWCPAARCAPTTRSTSSGGAAPLGAAHRSLRPFVHPDLAKFQPRRTGGRTAPDDGAVARPGGGRDRGRWCAGSW